MIPGQLEWCIRKIVGIRESAEGGVVSFSDAEDAILGREGSEYEWRINLLRLSQKAGSPVGIAVSHEGRILDVAGTDRDIVVAFGATPSTPRAAAAWFTRDQMLLDKGHPRYGELAAILTEARQHRHAVWYITKSGFILDVLQLTPEADATLGRLFEAV